MRTKEVLGENVEIHSSVKQGCVLSPLDFHHHHRLDFKEVYGKQAGIKWVDRKELSDLDFADDIVLLHGSWAGMKTMTSSMEKEAKQVGLNMNVYEKQVHQESNRFKQ